MHPLVNRYMLHVKSCLPRKVRDDVAAELEDNLRSQIEEREEAAGQPMDDAQLVEILAAFGHPMLVAGRYLPRQYLIGPSTFPVYWYAIKALVIVFAAIAVLSSVAELVQGAGWEAVLESTGETLFGMLAWGAIVTIVFASLDASGVRFFDGFRPDHLRPRPRLAPGMPEGAISRFETLFDIIGGSVLFFWWVGAFPEAGTTIGQISLDWGSAYRRFFYPVAVLLVIGLFRAVRNLVHPYWTRRALMVRIVHDVLRVAVVILAVRTPDLVVADFPDPATGLGLMERLVTGLGVTLRFTLVILVFLAVGRIAMDMFRVARR